AARDLKRPVKLYVTREQGFTVASFRAETRQEVKIGAQEDGLITTFVHKGHELCYLCGQWHKKHDAHVSREEYPDWGYGGPRRPADAGFYAGPAGDAVFLCVGICHRRTGAGAQHGSG